MTLAVHLRHPRSAASSPHDEVALVYAVQRGGAALVGSVLLGFGLLGFTRGVPLLSSTGERVAGLSANGVLAGLSVLLGLVLIAAALRGPRIASTVMLGLGVLFLLSALANLWVIGTRENVLAFQTCNVVFSVVVGLVLLTLGGYGRVSGNLPADSPYAHPHPWAAEPPDMPSTPEQFAPEAAMREAEIALIEHRATAEQHRRLRAVAGLRTRDERRRAWLAG